MNTAKKIIKILLTAILAVMTVLGVISASAVSDDPADSYIKQTAPYEDTSLSLWFDYSFRKNFTSDHTSTGMNTFSVYMAKNETESAQFVLYSAATKTGMQAEVTDFTDGRGNTIPADIYYEMYVTTTNLHTASVWGTNRFIRAGETPDPVMNIERLGTKTKAPTFQLNGGKSQAFLIRVTTEEDTPAGWYSAQLNIKNANGQTVKTATVYCRVWDFVISDETRMQTAFIMGNHFEYGGSYEEAYDYLLENRLNAMDIPTGKSQGVPFDSTNPYLTNPRVSAIRITGSGGGYDGKYSDTGIGEISKYTSIYNELSASPNWEQFKNKLYFYSVDEPLPYPIVGSARQTVDDCKSLYQMVADRWGEDPRFVVTPCEDFPYSERNKYYTKPMSQYSSEERKDADQEMIDTDTVTIFCPRIYALTPYSELQRYGRTVARENVDPIRGECLEVYSGCYGTYGAASAGNYDWQAVYGNTFDRYMSHVLNENIKGEETVDHELWMYSAGYNKSYTYTNHTIENTGLQTKLMFWQAYQNDVTGYLYYAVNNWNEQTPVVLDKTVTGSKTGSWPLNSYTISVPNSTTGAAEIKNVYGNGILFYGKNNAKTTSEGIVGSLRVEILRDSVEEYQMLSMLGDLKGKDRAKEIVSRVSTNVVRYLSLSGFDRSAWSSSMDDYDIMEAVRRGLGAELEAAVNETPCDHSWNGGTVKKAATCTAMGEKLFTCTACGAKRTEYIPSVHEVGNTFVRVSGNNASCTADGSKVLRCSVCGFKKTVTEKAFHSDPAHFVYASQGASGHTVTCDTCGGILSSLEGHTLFAKTQDASCTETGWVRKVCRGCGYYEEISTLPAGHTFVDGVCTVCGEPETDVPTFTVGDIDGDGKINAKDINLLKQIVLGTLDKVPAADIDGDGKVTVSDVALLKFQILS